MRLIQNIQRDIRKVEQDISTLERKLDLLMGEEEKAFAKIQKEMA